MAEFPSAAHALRGPFNEAAATPLPGVVGKPLQKSVVAQPTMTVHLDPNNSAAPGYRVILNHYGPSTPFFPATTIRRNEYGAPYTDFGVFPTIAAARTVALGAVSSILLLNRTIGLRGPSFQQLAARISIQIIDRYPAHPLASENILFAKESPSQAPVIKLPAKPDRRTPISGTVSLSIGGDAASASQSPFWPQEGKGWATTKEPLSLGSDDGSSVSGSLYWREEGEGWAITKEPLSPGRADGPLISRSRYWPEEGEGWATTKEPLWPRRDEGPFTGAVNLPSAVTAHANSNLARNKLSARPS